jgi:hypothetical protein
MFEIMSDLFQCICLSYTPLVVFINIYIKKSNEIRMLVQIKEISKKRTKRIFSQHSCTNVFTAVADLQVQCL